MKNIIIISMLIMFFLVTAFQNIGEEPSARITYFVGDVYKIKKAERILNKVEINLSLFAGDRIETKKESRCELTYIDGSIVRLDQYTIYKILESKKEEKKSENNYLSFGRLWANIKKMVTGEEHYNVQTPTAVAAIRGTVYQISSDSIQSNFKVFEGGINVTPLNTDGTTDSTKTIFEVDYGEEFILVNNFEEFRRQQERAFEEFQKQQQEAFEKFVEEDQQAFEEFKQRDLADFQKFKNYHILLDKFDIEKEKKDEWVKWNMDRDATLNR